MVDLTKHSEVGELTYEQVDSNWTAIEQAFAGLGTPPAAGITIADTGDYYASGDVEGALQEVGASLSAIDTQIGDIGTALDLINGEVI